MPGAALNSGQHNCKVSARSAKLVITLLTFRNGRASTIFSPMQSYSHAGLYGGELAVSGQVLEHLADRTTRRFKQ